MSETRAWSGCCLAIRSHSTPLRVNFAFLISVLHISPMIGAVLLIVGQNGFSDHGVHGHPKIKSVS
jgi:hypothetical protein